ncbi:MAG: dynamin family protein [Polyangiaceae bacterium]
MQLADVIGRVIGKVEIVLAGAEADLRDGQDALADGDALGARAAARRVLTKAPNSALGLALLADACDAAHLDAELAMVLEDLARGAPSRAEVWVRLARARRGTGAPDTEIQDALSRALSVAEPGSEERTDALLALADIDLARSDGPRAELWLERLVPTSAMAPAVAVRRAEAKVLAGDARAALRILEPIEWAPVDGRAALARGRALAAVDDPSAIPALLRAMIVGVAGASEALASAFARLPTDPEERSRVARVVEAAGERELPRWRAAFADAMGQRDVARAALASALREGDPSAALALLEAALDDRDAASLSTALGALARDANERMVSDARRIQEALSAELTRPAAALDALAAVSHPRALGWAGEVCLAAVHQWIPGPRSPVDYTSVLERLSTHARAQSDLDAVSSIADVEARRHHPVRLAVVGEFNAGKSTLINALIGADVAPTGVLPTTASIHHLQWAPDPFARLKLAPGQSPSERVVPLGSLRDALRVLDPASVERVEILLPLDLLRRIEIIDTPGFNADDPHHADVARAAFEQADIALWVVDATQAAKNTERRILEEARLAGLPVQLLVNKADRVRPDDLPGVMGIVVEAFHQGEMLSWAAPLPVSAKKALAGKLGDPVALVESGWPAVQTLLDGEIASRGGELKDRALRRRLRHVVKTLLARAVKDDTRQQDEAAALGERLHAVALAGAALERDPDAGVSLLREALTDRAAALRQDLAQVLIGRAKSTDAQDPTTQRYVALRTLEALSGPLAGALASLSGPARFRPEDLRPAVRALIRGSLASTREPNPEIDVLGLARAATAMLVEHLFALAASGSPTGASPALLRELSAFAAALE